MTSHQNASLPTLHVVPWPPRLGDLVLDSGKDDLVGVVVGVPHEEGSGWLSYHLQPPGGGTEWTAPADASTLHPVLSRVTHATVEDVTGLSYDWIGRRWSLPFIAHLADSTSVPSTLLLTAKQARALAHGLRNPPPPADAADRDGDSL
jgi:hypothetical protein